jgi:hypothetical protein
LIKSVHVGNRDFGQDFSVDFDSGLFQTFDQLTIGQPIELRRRSDTRNPQAAKSTFLYAPISISEC